MIAIGIRYLTKYAVATNLSRQRAEWPPHPGRVFMAMAAAHFESGAPSAERSALEWLESAPPPALRVSDADERSAVRAYVPVNDDAAAIIDRPKQDRAFPRVRPHEDTVYLIWAGSPEGDCRLSLQQLCAKVTRVGHSMSAVQMWVVPEGSEPPPNLVPASADTDHRLRIPAAGTMDSLESAFNGEAIQQYDDLAEKLAASKGKAKGSLQREIEDRFPDGRPDSRRPQLVTWQGYSRPGDSIEKGEVLDGPFESEFIVLSKKDGCVLGLESTLQLTGAIRSAVVGEKSPEWLSGHDRSGAPSLRPHVAFFPLPYVGFEHADGHVMGLGIAIPRSLGSQAESELRQFLGPLLFDPETGKEKEISIWWRNTWKWTLERETRERPPASLRAINWTKPSYTWASVTPVVLHHHPKRRAGDIERIVREAFLSALLPEPTEIGILSVSIVDGAGHAMALPPFTEGGKDLCRYQTHVVARFSQSVQGPVLVGRGRYRGYGLFRPVADNEARP